ncbi:hypothetical protein FQN54_002915 [Arachnomyces sp. PD_36]|nr:hypothetical protein FQN54_002915 [Arachnomyces sp. PD_36]
MTNRGPPSIVATCKQTRFHLLDDKPSREVDIQGLNIIISSRHTGNATSVIPETASTKSKGKGKSKAKSEGIEIVSGADLRLKAGFHYGLVGRNGTGKSTILRAVADKLIPGISYSTRISILQQTDADEDGTSQGNSPKEQTVLQHVMESNEVRNQLALDVSILSKALEETEDPLEPVRAIRQIRHEKLGKQLFLAQKNASLRSGSRGLQARKELKSLEKKVSASEELIKQKNEDIEMSTIQEETQSTVDTLQDLQSQLESMSVVDMEQEARRILRGLGFNEASFEKPFNTLSGGWRMRCMLAGVLTQNPDIMILDEPTNFLDLLGVIWLENYLKQLRDSSETTIVLVSHDRDFMNAVCEEIVILKNKSLSYFKGNISAYESDLEAQKLYWGRMKEAQDRQIAHMENTIKDNIKLGKKTGDDNKLRMAKSRQKKVDERMGVQVNATGGRFKLNRDMAGWHDSLRAEIEVPADEKGVSMTFPDSPDLRFPGPLISLEGAAFRYKPRDEPVLNGIDLVMQVGDRVGIMGLNGCGKSTLLKMLVGGTEPSKGTVSRHPRLKIAYYSQHSVDELQAMGRAEPMLTALSLLLQDVEGKLNEGEVRGLLGSLGLPGRTASDVLVTQLSGGQLVRLALARLLWNPPHLMVLDEVTTHLDFHTVKALSSALSSFSGAILLVSHDRYLIRSVIEGKKDLDAGAEGVGVEEDLEEDPSRKRVVYILKGGKLNEQKDGVEQFERSLEKRVRKMLG